jgi:hypothetical protein
LGTVTARTHDSIGYMAWVRGVRDDVTYHETETFDRRPAAAAWLSKRERELSKPRAVAKFKMMIPATPFFQGLQVLAVERENNC